MPWPHLTVWDGALLAAVTVQATAIAYAYQPRHKALLITLPIPFSIATLAIGRPVDATNVLGLGLLFGFTWAVWYLHTRQSWPIVAAIIGAALGYILSGALIARHLPDHDTAFWAAVAGCATLAAGLHWRLPARDEPGHRSPLPVYVKVPIIVGVVATLILIKGWLRGFVTVFPMVGVIAAYEARNSLWTMVRQIPVLMLALLALMVVLRLGREPLGVPGALASGWVIFLVVLTMLRGAWWR
jgi:uncharacterized protein (DUF697 family)